MIQWINYVTRSSYDHRDRFCMRSWKYSLTHQRCLDLPPFYSIPFCFSSCFPNLLVSRSYVIRHIQVPQCSLDKCHAPCPQNSHVGTCCVRTPQKKLQNHSIHSKRNFKYMNLVLRFGMTLTIDLMDVSACLNLLGWPTKFCSNCLFVYLTHTAFIA